MRRRKRAAEQHGERTGHSGTDHAGRDDAQRIGSGKGDNAFCDEREAHNIVGNGCLALFFGKAVFKERSAQGNGKRRNHTADPHGSHNAGGDRVAGGIDEGGCAKYISRFIERSAHVDAHHAADNRAEDDAAGCIQAGQSIADPQVQRRHRGIDDKLDDDANRQDAHHGIDQDRLGSFQRFRQLGAELLQAEHQISGYKAGDQCAEETGAAGIGQCAAHKSYRESGAVRDAHGDEAREDGQHKAERCIADGLKERRRRGIHAEVGRVAARG